MVDFKFKESYNFYDLVDIVKRLRMPDGCPWDKVQTHQSIRNNFLEETYEVCEAIDNNNTELLKEELGDVLLQVVFHAQMENEKDVFNIDDVADGICKKLIVRHPHIFGAEHADSADRVLDRWDEIKMQTKHQETYSQAIDGICKALPSLTYARKVQKKASKAGYDFTGAEDALKKVYEEADELKAEITADNKDRAFDELGDLIFAAVNVSRFINCDAEEALQKATNRFIKRFKACEELAAQRGAALSELNMSELDSLWEEVKINCLNDEKRR
ncbi:MAG: nucleoside triphosphate pyrophosphohydrolase [Clostridiales bacterium]|nr:nucleoside triphosphate pyrophosphohydrolase [Clostridiales bacterium]